MKLWAFFQPTISKIISLGLILLLWLVPTQKMATCKICWEQHHGFPITFIITFTSTSMPGLRYQIDSFSTLSLLIDVIVLYLLSCIIFSISYRLSLQK
jgi:hypothetical protein